MSKAKLEYLSAYVPEGKPKETPKRGGTGDGGGNGRIADIEAALAALNDLLAKQNRDNLDALYNLDMGNMSSSMKRLFQSYDDGITRAEAGIEAWANEMEAGFRAVAEWQDDTKESIAEIEGKANEHGASIQALASYVQTDKDGNIVVATKSLLDMIADQEKATASLRVEFEGEDGNGGLLKRVAGLELFASEDGAYGQFKAETEESLSALELFASEDGAYGQFKAETEESLSALELFASEDGAYGQFKAETEESLSALKLFASEDGAFGKLSAQVNGEDGLASAVSEVTTKANKNGEAISALQSAVYTTDADGKQITALAKFQNEVSSTYAKTSQFSSFKSEIEGSVSQTLAGFTTEADKTYAKTSQVAAILGEDGNVSFAEIAAGVSEDESFIDMVADKIKITADMLVLDSNVYITGVDDDETMLKIMGNRIALNHLHSADSGAGMGFWYNGIDNELLAHIYTDRDKDRPDDSRYTFNINAYSRGDKYPVAMKLSSEGGMSLESWSSIYAWAYSYLTLAAERNVRIRAEVIYDFAVDPDEGGFPCDENDYVFTTDGIYYNGECILPV